MSGGILEDILGWNDNIDNVTKINAIVDFWISPCQAPIALYATTLAPVLGRAFIAYVDFDLPDIIRQCVKPCFRRAHGIHRSVGRRGAGANPILNFPEFFCMGIGASVIKEAVHAEGLHRFLWLVDEAAQRAFYFLMILDIAIDGFFNWATIIKRSDYCRRSDTMALVAGCDEVICVALGGEWLQAGNFTPSYRDPGIAFSGSTIGIGPGHWELGVTGKYADCILAPGQMTLRWHGPQTVVGDSVVVPIHGNVQATCIAEVDGPGLFTAQQQLIGSLACTGGAGFLWCRRMYGTN